MPYLDILTKFIDSKNNVIPSCKPQRWGVKKVSVFFTRPEQVGTKRSVAIS